MKKVILILAACSTFLMGCPQNEIVPEEGAEISFTGVWQRQFEAGPGNWHTVLYTINQNQIAYSLEGPVGQAEYVMKRDTFLLENNRFIGHVEGGQYYLLFAKDVSSSSLTLYKQEITSISEGMGISIPSDTTTENHGWNTYNIQ